MIVKIIASINIEIPDERADDLKELIKGGNDIINELLFYQPETQYEAIIKTIQNDEPIVKCPEDILERIPKVKR